MVRITLFASLSLATVSFVLAAPPPKDSSVLTVKPTKSRIFSLWDPLAKYGNIEKSDFSNATLLESKLWPSGARSATYRLPKGPKHGRSDIPESQVKRGTTNIEGGKCLTSCGYSGSMANTDDCVVVYNTLYNSATQFSISSGTVIWWNYNTCSAYFVNLTDDTVVYDNWDLGGVSQYLNGFCLQQNGAAIGTCLYAPWYSFNTGVYASLNQKDYFG